MRSGSHDGVNCHYTDLRVPPGSSVWYSAIWINLSDIASQRQATWMQTPSGVSGARQQLGADMVLINLLQVLEVVQTRTH